MTEAEALTRWCPFARTTSRFPASAPVAVNRDPHPEVQSACLCIASACMAWQRDHPKVSGGNGDCRLMKS